MRMKIAAALCASSATLTALGCGGCWGGGVEALYLKPGHCPIIYAVENQQDGTFLSQRPELLKSDYHWGFRVGMSYQHNCFHGEVRYAYLNATDQGLIRGESIEDQSSTVTVETRGNLKNRYQQLDAMATQRLNVGCNYNFSIFALARWVDLQMSQNGRGITSTEEASIYSQSSCFNAGGLGVGLAGDFPLWCGLRAGGELSLTALAGDRRSGRTFVQQSDEGTIFRVFPSTSSTAWVANGEMQFYLSYSKRLCNADWTAKLGYEFHQFWDALRFREFNDDFSTCQPINLGGITLGLGVSF